MILGFISLFLTVTQNGITKICAPREWTIHMLPCSLKEDDEFKETKLSSKSHFQTFFSSKDVFGTARRLLGDDHDHSSKGEEIGYCDAKVLKLHATVLYILFKVLNYDCSLIMFILLMLFREF
jgi:mlo protein